jgi:hypothetical protein
MSTSDQPSSLTFEEKLHLVGQGTGGAFAACFALEDRNRTDLLNELIMYELKGPLAWYLYKYVCYENWRALVLVLTAMRQEPPPTKEKILQVHAALESMPNSNNMRPLIKKFWLTWLPEDMTNALLQRLQNPTQKAKVGA